MSSDLAIFLSILLLGSITFCYRYSFISTHGRGVAEKIPIRLLNLLAPASFAAIIVNNLLHSGGDKILFQQKLVASAIALVFAYYTRSVIFTFIFGLIVLYGIRMIS